MQPVCRLPEHKQRKQIVLLLLLPLLLLQVSLCSLPFFHACLLLSFWASSSLCSEIHPLTGRPRVSILLLSAHSRLHELLLLGGQQNEPQHTHKRPSTKLALRRPLIILTRRRQQHTHSLHPVKYAPLCALPAAV